MDKDVVLKIIQENKAQIRNLLNQSASSVDYNANGDQVIKSGKVEGALKDLDQQIAGAQKKIFGSGIMKASGDVIGFIPENTYAPVNHNHADKMDKIQAKDKNVPVFNGNQVVDSGVPLNSLADDTELQAVINQVKDVALKIENLKSILPGFASATHSHTDLLKDQNVSKGNILIDKATDSGVNITSLATVQNVNILFGQVQASLTQVIADLANKATKSHTHALADINTSDLKTLITQIFNDEMKDLVVKTVKQEIVNSLTK